MTFAGTVEQPIEVQDPVPMNFAPISSSSIWARPNTMTGCMEKSGLPSERGCMPCSDRQNP
jgi:hypothetical protein